MRVIWVPLYVLLLGGTTDGLIYYHTKINCVFNSTFPEDIQYIQSYFYNKLEFIRFDSNVGWFVGYTELGVKNAEKWNNNTAILERRRHEKDRYCVHNIPILYKNILSKSVEPYAVIHTASSSGSERVLVCSVYGFYPKDITVTWTNNQQQISTGVSNSPPMSDSDWTYQRHSHLEYTPRYSHLEYTPNNQQQISTGVSNSPPMSDSDWTYQRHSHLEYTPRSGDQISCVVEHISLKEPMVLDYEGALSDGDRNKLAIGASGLVLGLVLSLAGFIFYRHKSRGLILVPTH